MIRLDNKILCFNDVGVETIITGDKFFNFPANDYFIVLNNNEEKTMFYNGYVDYTNIFVVRKNLIDIIVNSIGSYTPMKDELRKINLNGILNCIMQNPPYLSIIEIKKNKKDKYYSISKYLSDEKIKDFKNIKNFTNNKEIIKLYESIDYNKLKSNYNKNNKIENNRYNYGINFCIKFLEKHYPNKIDEFFKNQNLNKELYFKNNIIKLKDVEKFNSQNTKKTIENNEKDR